MYIINSDFGQNQIQDAKGAKSTKQTELGVEKCRKLLLPIPPFKEQQAIVKRVQAKLALCDKLEAEITAAEQHTKNLSAAILQEVFDRQE